MSDQFYQKCIEVSGVDASDCIMIGDNGVEDVYMPKKNGMKAIWIKNPASAKITNNHEIHPDAELAIQDFMKLPEILKNM